MTDYSAILPILSALLAVGLGVFTMTRNPRHPVNIGFALGLLSIIVMETGNALMALTGAGQGLFIAGVAALPTAWLVFSLVFARPDYVAILRKRRLVIALAAIASVFFMFWALSGSLASLEYEQNSRMYDVRRGLPMLVFGETGGYFFIYLIIGLVANLVQLENTLRSSSGSKRWQIKYVIFGVMAIHAFFIYAASQAILYSTLSGQTIIAISVVNIISISLMGVFIVRHRLLDVEVFISRYVVYNSVTVLAVGVYLIAVGVMTQGIRYLDTPYAGLLKTLFVFVAALILVIALFTLRLRRSIQLFINRHFYSHKYEFRDKWMEATEKISAKRTVEEVSATLTGIITETMSAKNCNVWLLDGSAKTYAAPDGYQGAFAKIPSSHPLIKRIQAELRPFTLEEKAEAEGFLHEDIKTLSKATGAALCTPLITEAQTDAVGFILQGADLSGEGYGQDDFDLLRALAAQAAVQIRNLRLTQDLMRVKEMEAFNKFSAFIMHDLKNLTNSLSLVSQNARENINNPDFQKDAIRTIDATVTRMKNVIARLSNMPSREAELQRKDAVLSEIIIKAIKHVPSAGGKNVTLINEATEPFPIHVDPDAMEMVFINIILNAVEAVGQDGRIIVSAISANDCITATVADNGSGIGAEFIKNGMFKPFKTTKKSGLGIGLYQCKSIVENHGGSIAVESAEGRGTSFIITLPCPTTPTTPWQ
ncbi:MAG: PEP-CTERM system histidine kinase PrsK [Deltaproteobacteria bacterium]|nr:PEP-CTERM system histidine kinase PrsK [Deltaproteobacteria bacterium]